MQHKKSLSGNEKLSNQIRFNIISIKTNNKKKLSKNQTNK